MHHLAFSRVRHKAIYFIGLRSIRLILRTYPVRTRIADGKRRYGSTIFCTNTPFPKVLGGPALAIQVRLDSKGLLLGALSGRAFNHPVAECFS